VSSSATHFCSVVYRDGVYFVDCSECKAVAGFADPATAEAFATSHEATTDKARAFAFGLPGRRTT
jgi:hypothetical protein